MPLHKRAYRNKEQLPDQPDLQNWNDAIDDSKKKGPGQDCNFSLKRTLPWLWKSDGSEGRDGQVRRKTRCRDLSFDQLVLGHRWTLPTKRMGGIFRALMWQQRRAKGVSLSCLSTVWWNAAVSSLPRSGHHSPVAYKWSCYFPRCPRK